MHAKQAPLLTSAEQTETHCSPTRGRFISLVIEHARKLDAHGLVDDFWVEIDKSKLVACGTGDGPAVSTTIDARGKWLTPGFIDLHCHGGGGYSFEDGERAISSALRTHRAHGTTRSIVSLVASSITTSRANLDIIADMVERDPCVLGAHLEGPFLARSRRGAHDPAHLRNPTSAEVELLLTAARGTLRQITIAPELPGALDAIDLFVAADVRVAVGHTEATSEQARTAFEHGASLLTHVFNAMPGIQHRAPGPVLAAFGDPRVTVELILDGTHVHPDLARLVFAEKPDRVALISDAMAAAGAGDGAYRLGTLDVTVNDGIAHLCGSSTIAGSTLTLDVALRKAITEARIDAQQAISALTLTPARALGLDQRIGLLAPGYAADLVMLTHDWRVDTVWADGRLV